MSRLRLRVGSWYLPSELFDDDVFLVSYPRSGNTWVRLLIGNYLTQGECSPERLTYLVPDIHIDRSLPDEVPPPRFIKSHVPYVPEYRRVVYIVRDGRDVAVSYYHYYLREGFLEAQTPFKDFLRRFNKGAVTFGSWSDHVNSWMDQAPRDFTVVRYDDLKKDPVMVLLRIMRFAGLIPQESVAELAASRSGLDVWREAESDPESPLAPPEQGTGVSFARSGEMGQYSQYFDDEMTEEFLAKHGSTLRRLGFQ